MKKIDHTKLKATPEIENFSGKYEDSNLISKFLVDNYFKSVEKLLNKTATINSAHEIGCGEGRSTMKINKMISNLTASEYVESLIPLAKNNNPHLTIFQESVYELKYEDNSVDLVLLLEVLEHLDFPKLALEELKRISKKYIILGVPREPLWRFLNICRFKYLRHFGNTPGHLNHWSKKSIIKLVEKEYGKVIAIESPIPWTIILAEKHSS
ncbi:methyltransferase domain-containing protein [Flavobacterium degerlachei]|jgi:ubiquinone/menaquinone biosynthesis C-methylase UbiE|uniref:Ubiquinone/menaquinone biosynthesis C-methylase UbiE n=1 Tax=Flavobacterium degerlachei TaxID=229203 RepID=A0A1H2VYB5_9FLAO|nr:methyltransferase domain-containing protein [Flavobacterium degerlachei]SDW72994.1 Ubiquinone/menaquinone biosynthesis C-methylase UbiE [Flavobacterium degerlachei]